jgi:hypothetical protein
MEALRYGTVPMVMVIGVVRFSIMDFAGAFVNERGERISCCTTNGQGDFVEFSVTDKIVSKSG